MEFKQLNVSYLDDLVALAELLNPNLKESVLRERQRDMFNYEAYRCFGLFENDELIAISAGWLTVRWYSGKQLEVDNVVVDPRMRSKGIGSKLFEYIHQWAKENDCLTVELNAYVTNPRAHKFYYNEGYKVLGFHFQKEME
ncbi:MAG: GNAT family N-acetyltransferase [Flavobacteriales bacterium]|nr:GNAT family N-acetyltransferase [Flavobacteriales bacterium]